MRTNRTIGVCSSRRRRSLAAIARDAVRAGFQPATHAIGDAANRRVLDIYETMEKEVLPRGRLRPRIEHAQILDALDIPRFASLGVIASMQPTHCTSDMPWAPARLGAARVAEGAYVWQKLLQAGARLAAGSDFPVERPDPLLGFYAAVTRQTLSGEPPGGWSPAERLSRDEALRAFTLMPPTPPTRSGISGRSKPGSSPISSSFPAIS